MRGDGERRRVREGEWSDREGRGRRKLRRSLACSFFSLFSSVSSCPFFGPFHSLGTEKQRRALQLFLLSLLTGASLLPLSSLSRDLHPRRID